LGEFRPSRDQQKGGGKKHSCGEDRKTSAICLGLTLWRKNQLTGNWNKRGEIYPFPDARKRSRGDDL